MIFLKLLNAFFKERMFFFLIFALSCIEYATGGDGAGGSRGSRRRGKGIMQSGSVGSFSFDPNDPTQYNLGIYTRRFDGGSVLVLKDAYDYKKDSVVNIEDVLVKLKLLNVQYIGGGQVNVVENYKGIHGAYAGYSMAIGDLVRAIADWEIGNYGVTNWLVQGKGPSNEIFEPLFDGHVMVMFFNESEEKFRLHLTSKGLNFYDKGYKQSYFVRGSTDIGARLNLVFDQENKTEASTTRSLDTQVTLENHAIRTRSQCPFVQTRHLNLHQLINIAYKKVTRGRNIVPDFKCHHFVYEFIIAIAENRCKGPLFVYQSWPEDIRSLDEFLEGYGNTAFNQVVAHTNKREQINDDDYNTPVIFN
uniref:Uncharacterized protein n=1 Tax=Meloidogyne javanica TaxID=6303 RepID=A0A915LDL5_MELJA